MQEETKQEKTSAITPTYDRYCAFLDFALKVAIDEYKLMRFDRDASQSSYIKQSLYLTLSMSAVLGAIISQTPYLSPDALLHGATGLHLLGLCLSIALCLFAFAYGVWCLRGENYGQVPVVANSFSEYVATAYGDDESPNTDQAKLDWLDSLDKSIEEVEKNITKKGRKIRLLNKVILSAFVIGALSSTALFSNTLMENYVQARAQSVCSSEAQDTFKRQSSIGAQNDQKIDNKRQ